MSTQCVRSMVQFGNMLVCSILLITLLGLVSCFPIPGTSSRTPQMSGRVIDMETRRPIAGAQVALRDAPKLRSSVTDRSGRFLLKESRNVYLYQAVHTDTGMLRSLDSDLAITCHGYHSKEIDPRRHAVLVDSSAHPRIELRDILLRPLK